MSSITLEWKTEQRGAVKTAFYRPANLQVVVKSAKASDSSIASWRITQKNERIVNGYKSTMLDCQLEAKEWLLVRGWYGLWDSEYLASKIQPYLLGYPLALLDSNWAEKLGEYCNTPARVVAQHPAIEAHKQWVKWEWIRLNLIEARLLNASTYAQHQAIKNFILEMLGKEVE